MPESSRGRSSDEMIQLLARHAVNIHTERERERYITDDMHDSWEKPDAVFVRFLRENYIVSLSLCARERYLHV